MMVQAGSRRLLSAIRSCGSNLQNKMRMQVGSSRFLSAFGSYGSNVENKMRVQMESRRTITPANTGDNAPPNVLLPLSTVDFSIMREYIRVMYAFQAPTPQTVVLREGLAKVLLEFREWAGRFTEGKDGRPAIDLNDKGVVWVEATADGPLADLMPFNPSPFLQQLFPPIDNGVHELLLVQVTRFACGGLVIGVARHHHVADGAAASVFMNGWSQIVRGQPIHPLPVHDRSLLMARDPPRPTFDHIEYDFLADYQPQQCDQNTEIITKKIHFGAELLKKIKETASENVENPYTRFESLFAHLWRCVSIVRGLNGDAVTRISFSVNGKSRLNPPLPAHYFGNAVLAALSETTVVDLVERPLHCAANLVHKTIMRMDDEYIRSALDFLELQWRNRAKSAQINHRTIVMKPHLVHLIASSLINFPLYELDFGWGRPLYAGPLSSFVVEGRMLFIPSYTKDGSIDVLVCLSKEDMAKLEQICHKP